MWQNEELKSHLDTASSIKTASLVQVEWNLNDPANIDRIGNYRHRPTTSGISRIPLSTYDPFDYAGEYTGATLADTVIEGELDDNDEPSIFTTVDDKMRSLFSLDDCFQANRPRSGINKILMLPGKRWLPANNYVDGKPRYYPGTKFDNFKYWTSFRNISPKAEPNASARYPGGAPATLTVGLSKNLNGTYYIEDACPFVVYKEEVFANRITIKMQTHASSVEGPPAYVNGINVGDPTYGYHNQQTPSNWSIQVLKNNVWVDAFTVTETSLRDNGEPVIGPDGHVEIAYGLRVPRGFRYMGRVADAALLPNNPQDMDAYLVADDQNAGYLHTYNQEWTVTPAIYDWHLLEDDFESTPIDNIAAMSTFFNGIETRYRDIDNLRGMRVVVYNMNTLNSTFDLIELSPRLVADVTNLVTNYSVKKALSSMDSTDLPVGYLLPGTGSVSLIDDLSLFTDSNSFFNSLVELNAKFVFYEGADDVKGKTYFVPLKTMYTESQPPKIDDPPLISFELRDGFWILEKTKAPSLFMRDVSLSVAVSTLLDYIGFSNYTFKRISNDEPIIPFFYTSNEKTVAEVLQDLARSTQTAMFFDEYNNFVAMSRKYLTSLERGVDGILSGNSTTPHIIALASVEKKRYNDGRLDYNERYIQRSIRNLRQANFVNEDQTLIYKPVLLWEAGGTELTRANNEMGQMQSSFSLGACALNVSLSNLPPSVHDGKITNNIIDVGESIYWLPRYNGYFYANGEIIKFDAVEYAVGGVGNVWISSNSEYQKYFADVPFNGKIFPTGRVRIFVEPELAYGLSGNLEIIGIKKHGRAQFQTKITSHNAGLASEWKLLANRTAIEQDADYLFAEKALPSTVYVAQSGKRKSATNANVKVNGIVKNHFRNVQYTEAEVSTFQTALAGTLQSSALVLTGVTDPEKKSINYVYTVHKTLEAPYAHYGARMKVIGEVKAVGDTDQNALGESVYYNNVGSAGSILTGGSGGIAITCDTTNNTGYYLELIALSNTTIEDDVFKSTDAHNVILYKNLAPSSNDGNAQSVPVKMWGGRANIVVDTGEFVGQGRQSTEDFPSVYDIAVETKNIGSSRRFFIYVNGKQVGVVDDPDPLPVTNTYGLFVRGSSRVMFENTYALYSTANSESVIANSIGIGTKQAITNGLEPMRRFLMNETVINNFVSEINTSTPPDMQMYYDEFGTIMRECAYFNIKFDKAFPAMRAKMSPTFNSTPTYTVSGFTHDAYGAEFLVFNITDKAVNLDETSGSYLRIQGVAFTQSNQRSLTVDQLLDEVGSLSDSFTASMGMASDPLIAQSMARDIRIDRRKRGRTEFSLNAEYVQRQDDAQELMMWLTEELTKQRLLVGLEVFPYPILQLGDIVQLDYTDPNGVGLTASKSFIVYNMEYDRDESGLSQKIYLSEVG